MKIYITLLLTFLLFGCNSRFNQASFYLPADEEMKNKFLKNEVEFNKLVGMFSEEGPSVTFISKEKNKPWFQKNIADERWNEYQRLFDQIRVPYGIRGFETFDNQKPITFFISCEDLSAQEFKHQYDEFFTGDKGYAYSKEELQPLVNSLDTISDKQLEKSRYFFKKIKDDWYLYYSIGIRKPE